MKSPDGLPAVPWPRPLGRHREWQQPSPSLVALGRQRLAREQVRRSFAARCMPGRALAGRMDSITYVGLDVHKATVSVAVAESGRGGEVRQLGVFENRPEVLSKLAARLSNKM